ncbi:hypothetical protein [Magnetospirillum molischianum]|uniref:hypothetical protein n=1 Tax=Magnetospirillum molischianum TaxID=1083 RepID=UPI0002EE0043|nr:hypothetical protein [Magnetospirillum molischianum]
MMAADGRGAKTRWLPIVSALVLGFYVSRPLPVGEFDALLCGSDPPAFAVRSILTRPVAVLL